MISERIELAFKDAWAASIPVPCRFNPRARYSGFSNDGAIMGSTPPDAILEKWLAMVSKPHLTADQRNVHPGRNSIFGQQHRPTGKRRAGSVQPLRRAAA
jgi:hypothetical protein